MLLFYGWIVIVAWAVYMAWGSLPFGAALGSAAGFHVNRRRTTRMAWNEDFCWHPTVAATSACSARGQDVLEREARPPRWSLHHSLPRCRLRRWT
jgi:hypothetical protein